VSGALETTICSPTRPTCPQDVSALAFVRATEVQQPAANVREPVLHQLSRVWKGSAFTALGFGLFYFHEWNGTDSTGAILFRYLGGLVGIFILYVAIRLALKGFFKRVAMVGVALLLIGGLLFVGWGYRVACQNSYLQDLVALGA
jgi:hypothetical protein